MNEKNEQVSDGGTPEMNAELGQCPCRNWAAIGNNTFKHLILTGHHKTCPNSRSISNADYERLIRGLLDGIEKWANCGDGIPNFIGDVYTKSKVVTKT